MLWFKPNFLDDVGGHLGFGLLANNVEIFGWTMVDKIVKLYRPENDHGIWVLIVIIEIGKSGILDIYR